MYSIDAKNKIIGAAIRCIAADGFDKLTLNGVAVAAQVSRPTLYRHFPTREHLYLAAMRHAGLNLHERLMALIAQHDSPRERVLAALLFVLTQLHDDPGLSVILKATVNERIYSLAIADPEAPRVRLESFRAIYAPRTLPDEELMEIAGFVIRMLMSLLTMPDVRARDAESLRGYLSRRVLPGMGL